MNTGFVTTSFPRHPGDFAGCFVDDAARACADAGETVEVISAGPTTAAATVPRADNLPGHHPAIRVYRIPPCPGVVGPPLFFGAGAPEALEEPGLEPWIQATFFWAALCDQIRDRARGWNRIVAHWLVPSALAADAVAPHLPLTAYAHSGDVALLERLPGGIGAALGRHLAGAVDDLIFVSADLHTRFARLTGATVGRVERLVPATVDRPPARGSGWCCEPGQADRVVVLSVGRLVAIKGFDILLRAVAASVDGEGMPARQALSVVILGEGPERERLQKLARGLEIDLHLPGSVPRHEVRRWMAGGADLYVQPSRPLPSGRTEGLPMAVLEALQAGLPVIASNTGGLGELDRLGSRRGAVTNVSADDVPSLARGLAALATDPVTRRWRPAGGLRQ